MTRIIRLVAAALGLALLTGPLARAQQPSLAEVAQRESERRKAQGTTSKVYTNEDIKKGKPLTVARSPGAARAEGEAEGQKDATKPGSSKKTAPNKVQAASLERALALKEQASKRQLEAERLQKRIDELNAGVLNAFDQVARERLLKDRDAAIAEYRTILEDVQAKTKAAADLEAEVAKGTEPGKP